ncbi:MAG: radical SAM family heme chaperone HemW [Pseudomonadota bacterium]
MSPTHRNPDAAGFGVYVHWPFCAAKCPYCDFNSHVRHGGVDEAQFTQALVREIARTAERIGPRTVGSVFFGGGTPSLMSGDAVGSVLDAVAQHWSISDDAEITLEANPTSVEAGRLRDYRTAGINRVSLGVQALNDRDLKALGRLHTVREARAAVSLAQGLFDRVSFDLIYARTGQSTASWRDELRDALAMAAGHLSLYQLTIEPGTPFAALHAAGRLQIPDPELADTFYDITQELTDAAGLPQYETSNHARVGEVCRHNLLYWRYGEYAGIGPGAHGRIQVSSGRRTATLTEKMPERWRDQVMRTGHGVITETELADDEMADELLLMGLRLTEGVDIERLATLTGRSLCRQTIQDLAAAGFVKLKSNGMRLRAEPAGRFVIDRLVLELAATMQPHADAVHSPA